MGLARVLDTTVMVRNLPSSFTKKELMAELESAGFGGQYDYVYVPRDLTTGRGPLDPAPPRAGGWPSGRQARLLADRISSIHRRFQHPPLPCGWGGRGLRSPVGVGTQVVGVGARATCVSARPPSPIGRRSDLMANPVFEVFTWASAASAQVSATVSPS